MCIYEPLEQSFSYLVYRTFIQSTRLIKYCGFSHFSFFLLFSGTINYFLNRNGYVCSLCIMCVCLCTALNWETLISIVLYDVRRICQVCDFDWNVNEIWLELGSPERWMKFYVKAKIQFQDSFFFFIFWFRFLRLQATKNKRRKWQKTVYTHFVKHFEFLSWQFSDGFDLKHVLIQFVVISKIYIVYVPVCLCVFCAFSYEFGSSTLFIDFAPSFTLYFSISLCFFFLHCKTLPYIYTVNKYTHIYNATLPKFLPERFSSKFNLYPLLVE